MCNFIDNLDFEKLQLIGRPRVNFKDIIKSLLVMSFNGMSYRRTQPDLKKMQEEGLLYYSPPKSTLNDYCNNENTLNLLEKLIRASSLFFIENENTLIIDSTWLAKNMYNGGHRKVHDKKHCSFDQTRKLHIAILKNSKIITYAKAGAGTTADCPLFEEMINQVVNDGFLIENVLADAAYSSKDNYALCKRLGIMGVYIDFRSNASYTRSKSDIWKEKLKLFKEQKAIWKESYRYRILVEQVFSAIKRKMVNYLRSRNDVSQDIELLLKCLVYNLTVIGKYS